MRCALPLATVNIEDQRATRELGEGRRTCQSVEPATCQVKQAVKRVSAVCERVSVKRSEMKKVARC